MLIQVRVKLTDSANLEWCLYVMLEQGFLHELGIGKIFLRIGHWIAAVMVGPDGCDEVERYGAPSRVDCYAVWNRIVNDRHMCGLLAGSFWLLGET